MKRDPDKYISLSEALRRGIDVKMPGWKPAESWADKKKKARKGSWRRRKKSS